MTLEQLRIFVAVAERQNMTRAAETLHITQSAVSAAIAVLEGRYGAQLFNRVGRGIELSSAGRAFLSDAKVVLGAAANAERTLSDLTTLVRGSILVQGSQTVSSYWLPPRLVQFRLAYPQIEIELAVANTAQVAQAVLSGAAEIGVVEGPIDVPALSCEPIGSDRLTMVVGATHPWAKTPPARAEELLGSEWVLREPGSGTQAELEMMLASLGLDISEMTTSLVLPSNEALCVAVRSGAGVTAVSELVAAAGLRSGFLHRLPFDFPMRSFLLIQHRERPPSRAAKALLAVLRESGQVTPPK